MEELSLLGNLVRLADQLLVGGAVAASVRTTLVPDRMSSAYCSLSSPSGISPAQLSASNRARRTHLKVTPLPSRRADRCTGASGRSAVACGVTPSAKALASP